MSLKDVEVPLAEQIKKSGRGAGHLDISKLKLKPTGVLGLLVEYGGMATGSTYDMTFTGVDFTLRDGRICYDNFTMTFPGDLDMKFRGSVGFDDSVELWVSLSIRAGLFQKMGVKGPVDQYARVLGAKKARVEIPVASTRLAPKLGDVDIKSIVEQAVKELLLNPLEKGPKIPGGLLEKIPGLPK